MARSGNAWQNEHKSLSALMLSIVVLDSRLEKMYKIRTHFIKENYSYEKKRVDHT
jgi:hypothetical protein